MGKINSRMRKSRENITNDVEPISQEVIHEHEWQFASEYHVEHFNLKSKFVCLCGAVKRVKQFEVEE